MAAYGKTLASLGAFNEALTIIRRAQLPFKQADGYCEALNNSYVSGGPVRYFVLSNGLETNIYEPGKEQPALALDFKQFVEGNTNYRQLKEMLQPMAFSKSRPKPDTQKTIHFSKPSIAEVNHVFAKCHQHIHQSDKISEAKGFEEFVKLITLNPHSPSDRSI